MSQSELGQFVHVHVHMYMYMYICTCTCTIVHVHVHVNAHVHVRCSQVSFGTDDIFSQCWYILLFWSNLFVMPFICSPIGYLGLVEIA